MGDSRHGDAFVALWSDPFSRRALLRTAGAGAVALGAVGCTADTPRDAPDGSGSGAGGADNDQISAALANVFFDLDPTVASTYGTVAVNDFLYESLYRLDPFPPRTELTPELATELPREIDPVTYRIGLRDDAAFHDGSPLTADDVAFTIERIKDPDVESLFARFFEIIEEVEAVGEHDIELRLTDPTTLLAQRLVLVKGMSRAAVESSPEALALEPVGTGPYRVSLVVSGQEVTLERFDGYTGPREFSYNELDILVALDGNARVTGLRSGRTQVIESVPPSSFDGLAAVDDIEADGVRGDLMTSIMFHCGKPPFDDPLVRQAVLHAIDRDAITQTSYFGHAEPVWAGEVSPSDPDYAQPDLVYQYDPTHARDLLARAGYGDGDIEVDFLAGTSVDYLDSQAPLIEENLRAVGFVPNLIPGELESLYSRVAEGSYNLFLIIYGGEFDVVDAEFNLRWLYYGSLPRQFMYWDGEPLRRVEEMLDEALTAPDDQARADALAEVQNIIQNEVPIGALHRVDFLSAWSASLTGFQAAAIPGFVLDGVAG